MKIKETFLTIDPPSGWKYGFPKTVTQEQYKSIKNLKQWCIDNGYPKAEADSYGDYFYIQVNGDLSFTLMNEKTSTKELHLQWWDNLPTWGIPSKEYYIGLYYSDDDVTPERIEQIWKKEVQIPQFEDNLKKISTKEIEEKRNQKQFKQFDESLFKAYLNKFSEEDKFKAFISNLNELSKEVQFNAFLATLKKMNLDSQTQSNIMALVALRNI